MVVKKSSKNTEALGGPLKNKRQKHSPSRVEKTDFKEKSES